MASKRLEVVSIPISDPDRSLRFYRDILGFHVLIDNVFSSGDHVDGEDEQRWLQLAATADAETSITLVTWFPDMPAGSLHGLILKVDDIERERESLIKEGLEVAPTFATPWGKFAGFKDPDGNGWSLHGE